MGKIRTEVEDVRGGTAGVRKRGGVEGWHGGLFEKLHTSGLRLGGPKSLGEDFYLGWRGKY